MFDIIDKETNEIIRVFYVKPGYEDSAWFLVYKNNNWQWVLSDNYRPILTDVIYKGVNNNA